MTELALHGDAFARGADLDLAVNVVPGGPPPWMRDALATALARHTDTYPDERAAVEAVARRHGRRPGEVVLLNGAAEGFWLAAALQPRRPVVVHPSFTEPDVALRAAGASPTRIVLDPPWTLDPDRVPPDTDLVVVGNPTNPTGVLHPKASLEALCRPGRITVVDEAFMDFVPGEPDSLAGDRGLPGLVVLRSLTKVHAIPGIRAGYALASPPLAARLRAHRPGWSVNALALAAIEAAARHPDHARAIAQRTTDARADLMRRLAPHAHVHPAAANFVLAHRPGAVERLRAHGIAVRPCHTFPGLTADHLRIAVRDATAHRRLAAALA